ncbi:hypothetical protein PBI_BIGNUZ_42 [Mycobacterium phage BigNuz]|uniref:Uncharacterized protein n=2 Tax=Bignuzvirus bignuz TaxID=1983736 RepID=G1JX57_9CAUD|nr:hypothetical protein PBI_BIGNUZ_42 [Mycobacterium phage BigNuz]AEL98205.1 hypothetical protein PBI_BIGNUZ_42 [Mycobacterium phage BigNuz]AOT24882.1 hypothetical protein PBI_NAZO_43 [Mycobacterium phage Nazo]
MQDRWGRTHNANVEPRFSPIFGLTYQPVCSCGHRGGQFMVESRAMQAADEHENRAAGWQVTVR